MSDDVCEFRILARALWSGDGEYHALSFDLPIGMDLVSFWVGVNSVSVWCGSYAFGLAVYGT